MQVKIHQAELLISKKFVKLTKSVAKQFPILDARDRWFKMESGEDVPVPICKVNADTIKPKYPWTWLYLIEIPNGLAWVAANEPGPEYAATVAERGGYVDVPESVPTVIL